MNRSEENLIYFDHAATCPMRPEALTAMEDAMEHLWGNASPTYPPAQKAKTALDQARTVLADSIHAGWHDIFFTSGGTEGDNWALTGAAEAATGGAGGHGNIVVSAIEHHAILHTAEYLHSRGFDITYLPVDREGFVDPQELARVLDARPDTILVSVMTANNEVGTIEPMETLCKYTHDHGALFHTDAVQAYGKIPIDVQKVPVDLLSVSAHKVGGPKGIGFLYIRRGVQIQSLMHGGAQESGRRAGTENVPAAVGFAAAARAAMEKMAGEQERERILQQYFYERLVQTFPDAVWNGPAPGTLTSGDSSLEDSVSAAAGAGEAPGSDGGKRLYNNLSISFPGLDTETILINLDLANICASGGSACTTGALDPSHVIMAMTHDAAIAKGTIRFTIGPENTREEVDRTIAVLQEICARARQMN